MCREAPRSPGPSSRRWLDRSPHSGVAYSTVASPRQVSCGRITSVLNSPIIDSAIALSYESPRLPTDGSIPSSAERSVLRMPGAPWVQGVIELFCESKPVQDFAKSTIEGCCHSRKSVGIIPAYVSPTGQVLSEQPVCVLIGSALPRTAWIAEVNHVRRRHAILSGRVRRRKNHGQSVVSDLIAPSGNSGR